ncbi:MAG: hypothetical protein ABI678_10705 [Kofleriaceae bacterium]
MTDSVTQFFAPRARLVDVASNQVIGGDQWNDTNVLSLVSARVTLVNTGVAQLTVVLDNTIFDAQGLPKQPPWLYNALDRIRFGQKVRLDLTYGDGPWTKMIVAQINDMQFGFAGAGPAQVTLTGEDLLSRLKAKPTADKAYARGTTEEQMVDDVVSRSQNTDTPFAGSSVTNATRDGDGYLANEGSAIEWPTITEDLAAVTHQKAQTYLQFLQSLADRMDFEIFVDFKRNYLPLDEPGTAPTQAQPDSVQDSDVMLHFEPARSLLAGGAPSFYVPLFWGPAKDANTPPPNLLSFTPKLKVWDLVTSAHVRGRNPTSVTRIQHEVEGDAASAAISEDLGSTSDTPLVDAITLRGQLLDGISVPIDAPLEIDATNLGEERAKLLAVAKLREKARELISVEATTLGFPSLRAGMHVDVQGLHAPFDGLYYVLKAIHTFDSGGYKTQLTLRRPGMQDPTDYEWALGAS